MSTESAGHEHPGPKSACEICRNERDFEMPADIVDACADGRLVIFAGAGVSTESRTVLRQTFYDRIAGELGGALEGEAFPALMSRFAEAKGRRLLLQRLKERLEYVNAFPELRQIATRFHRELGTLFYVQDIVTTNWDPYFEEETGAQPLVTDKDFALWDMPGRKVLKIHGSIFNLGSIVATQQDYDHCYRALSRNVLGSTLKQHLATKTLVFVGYSFRDADFNRIYGFVRRQMADVLPRSYIISLDDEALSAVRDAHVIATDGAFFIRRLKAQLLSRGCLLDDSRWDGIWAAHTDIYLRHQELYEKVDSHRVPAVVLCGHYQDGLMHAFGRMRERRGTGEYSHIHDVEHQISEYEGLRKKAVRRKRYHDAAYIEGYQNGLLYLMSSDKLRRALPKYFVYGSDRNLKSLTAFNREAAKAQQLHRGALKQAERIAMSVPRGTVVHHTPEL